MAKLPVYRLLNFCLQLNVKKTQFKNTNILCYAF